jgi:hypothetical protein
MTESLQLCVRFIHIHVTVIIYETPHEQRQRRLAKRWKKRERKKLHLDGMLNIWV